MVRSKSIWIVPIAILVLIELVYWQAKIQLYPFCTCNFINMSRRPPYLTKSRFKLALECPTKLFYTANVDYADQGNGNEFIKALAKGGYQVGELAKYKYCDDPIGDNITIEERGVGAVMATMNRLLVDGAVIAEGAFQFENLYVRADIVVRNGNRIKLIEVKSKSWDSNTKFFNKSGNPESSWFPYLYDLAFQTYVLRMALPEFQVEPYLLLVDKEVVADKPGMNQWFKIKESDEGRYEVITEPNLIREEMGSLNILREINMREEVKSIFSREVPTKGVPEAYRTFESFVNWCSELYTNDDLFYTPIGSKCKECTYRAKDGDGLRCGFTECWSNENWYIVGKQSQDQLNKQGLITELWLGQGGAHLSSKLYDNHVPYLNLVSLDSLAPSNPSKSEYLGMSPHERRGFQIESATKGNQDYIFLKTEFLNEMKEWEWPLHMIDFETSTTAIPYFLGVHPYETIAFQFSHHIMHQDGKVEHYNDWLSFQAGIYPNLDFLRALKTSLQAQPGSVFRYSNHENSVLRHLLYDVEMLNPDDKDDLIQFIDSLTQYKAGKTQFRGSRNMIDLAALVRNYYYSPFAKGSNSIKQILPAVLNDCLELRELYSRPGIYGNGLLINSRNYDDHIWLQKEFNFDPYKTLPTIQDINDSYVTDVFDDFSELGDGTAAMTAYNKLQYSFIDETERQTIAKALLNYCELDTLAMVIIMQGLLKMEERREYP